MSISKLKKVVVGTIAVQLVLLVLVSLLGTDTILKFRPHVLHNFIANLTQREPEEGVTPYSDNVNITTAAAGEAFENYMRFQWEIQAKRKHTLTKGCRKYRKNAPSTFDVVANPPWNIIVDREHRLMFCVVPKVAFTSWTRVFLALKGVINDTDDASQFDVNHRLHYELDYFREQSLSRREHILKNYTKIMIARDPFSRVLSAYKNKLEPNSTFARAGHWQRGLGQAIIEYFHGQRGSSFDGTTYDLTFEDFVRFLVAEEPLHNQNNKHWKEVHRMCLPCVIDYDVVGKFETISTEAEFIMRTSGISDLVSFPSSDGSSPTNSSQQLQRYYSQLPEMLVKALYERYRLDFELFGYKPHDFSDGIGI